MQAAVLMVRCLEAEGVERIYAIPGEETLELVEALRDSRIEVVIVRHEQGAAFMADVHGRLTGRAGVCLGTLGPGATNLITGIGFFMAKPAMYDTWVFYSKIALVVLGGVNVLYFTMLDEVWAVGSGDEAPATAKGVAASAIVVWLGVLFCGHMLPFLGVSF